MTPFYPTEETAPSRALYEDLEKRFSKIGGATVIGGWAVDALTSESYQEQSRDVDVVFSRRDAFNHFRHDAMPAWRLEWAGTARRPTNACRFKEGHGPRGIAVDVFFLEGSDARLQDFHTMGAPLYKRLDCSKWLPTVPDLLLDKLTTLPLRGNREDGSKRFKDGVDSWALIFHNTADILPDHLRSLLPPATAKAVRKEMPQMQAYAERNGNLYQDALLDLDDWLGNP